MPTVQETALYTNIHPCSEKRTTFLGVAPQCVASGARANFIEPARMPLKRTTQNATKRRSSCPDAYLPVCSLYPLSVRNLDGKGRTLGTQVCASKSPTITAQERSV